MIKSITVRIIRKCSCGAKLDTTVPAALKGKILASWGRSHNGPGHDHVEEQTLEGKSQQGQIALDGNSQEDE